jgi:hypothetical protein
VRDGTLAGCTDTCIGDWSVLAVQSDRQLSLYCICMCMNVVWFESESECDSIGSWSILREV